MVAAGIDNRFSDLRVCALTGLANELQDVRSVLFELACADARDRDEGRVVGGHRLRDRDQGVVAEDDVWGHLLFPGHLESPGLERHLQSRDACSAQAAEQAQAYDRSAS